MRPWTRALGAALVLVGMTAGSAFTWPDRLDGRPEQLEIGGDSGYYVWTDGGNAFHLATTGPGPERRFEAVIVTDGEITGVDQVRLEAGDNYELLAGGKKLVVRFETYGQLDTIRWSVGGGQRVGFDFRVDGHPIRPVNVYLGHEGYDPPAPVFRIAR